MLHAAHRVIYASIITIYIHSHTYTYTYRYRYIQTVTRTSSAHVCVCVLYAGYFYSYLIRFRGNFTARGFPPKLPNGSLFSFPSSLPACSNLCFLVVVTERNCHARACQWTSWRREESIAVQLTIIREEEFPLLVVVFFLIPKNYSHLIGKGVHCNDTTKSPIQAKDLHIYF